MKRQFQKADPNFFDLAWLDDEELHTLQEAMLSSRENDICGYWLRCLNEQVAIRAGKLRILPGAEARDPDFKKYPISDLHAAQLIFGAIGTDFKAAGKPNGQRFCEMLVQCCEGVLLERNREPSYSREENMIQYEHILRAIGQGLEALSVEQFELEATNEVFVVQGSATQKEAEKPNAGKLSAFKKAFLDICDISKTPTSSEAPAGQGASSRSLRLEFTQKDIDKLERDGQALRSDWEASPLVHSLPQLLRTVGWYVDHNQGRLHKFSKNGDSLTVSYVGSIGREKSETFTLLQLYDMWVRLYKRRKGHIQIGPESFQ
jgi:hypothetical protein